jgi:hypothetical protein
LLREIERVGIKVYWGVIGLAAQALAALIDGTLHSDQFVARDARDNKITFPDEGRASGRRS